MKIRMISIISDLTGGIQGPYFPTPFFFFRVLMVDDCSPAFDVLDGAGGGDAGNFG